MKVQILVFAGTIFASQTLAAPELLKTRRDDLCTAHTLQSGDSCAMLAQKSKITVAQLEEFNQNTWDWEGCARLYVGQRICLSAGEPPFPAPIANANCGPTVPGTERPPKGTNWADLNPCEDGLFCNKWGICQAKTESRQTKPLRV